MIVQKTDSAIVRMMYHLKMLSSSSGFGKRLFLQEFLNDHIALFAVHLLVGCDDLSSPPVRTVAFKVAWLATVVAKPFVGPILLLRFVFLLLFLLCGSTNVHVSSSSSESSSGSIFAISGMRRLGGFG